MNQPVFTLLRYLPLFCILLFFLAACDERKSTGPEEEKVIHLNKFELLPPRPSEQSRDTLKVAVAAILSPQGTIQSYQPFIRVLESKTDREVVLIQRKTYQEVNDLLARNVVDVAFVCTGAYIEQKKDMELLVIPQINGKMTYRSLLIVSKDSGEETLADLRDKVFAFTDPLSNTGYRYPLVLLQNIGEKPETFFSQTIFTYSHDRSITAVVDGIVNGAAVDSIVYDFYKDRDHQVAAKTRVINQSQEFGMPPVVVPIHTSQKQKKWLRDIFLHVHNDSKGRKALDIMGVDRFVEPDPSLYHF